jgi:hypothetical protein
MPRKFKSQVLFVAMVACFLPAASEAQTFNGRSSKVFGGVSATFVDSGRLQELSCLGLPPGDYTEIESDAGRAVVQVDGAGRLHVSIRGTFAWAIYPYADDIASPYDAQHDRLYLGETEFSIRTIVGDYVAGSTWTYTLPSVDVSGINGHFTLIPRADEPFYELLFSDSEPGHGLDNQGGTVGFPVCPAQ